MVMSRSESYAQRHFGSWLGIDALATLGLVVLGAVLDVVRRGKVGAASMAGLGAVAAPGSGGVGEYPVVHKPVDAAQRRAYVMGGLRLIAIGVGILVIGVIVTYALSSLLRGSGTAILATGALAVGLVSIARGLYYVFIRGFIR